MAYIRYSKQTSNKSLCASTILLVAEKGLNCYEKGRSEGPNNDDTVLGGSVYSTLHPCFLYLEIGFFLWFHNACWSADTWHFVSGQKREKTLLYFILVFVLCKVHHII